MVHTVVLASDNDLDFAHDITRGNMAAFYATHGRIWDRNLFESSWPRTENYCVLEDGERIGILRLAQEGDTLYLRDLQVVPAHRSRGAGTFAMHFAQQLLGQRGLKRLRLNVFSDNPAQSLYRHLGFREVASDRGMLVFEKSEPVPIG